MTNILRIAHPPREAECIAKLLLMQVILVCVVHATQKIWYAGRMACDDRPKELEEGASLPPADSADISLRKLWECIADSGEPQQSPQSLNFSLGGYRLVPFIPMTTRRPVSGWNPGRCGLLQAASPIAIIRTSGGTANPAGEQQHKKNKKRRIEEMVGKISDDDENKEPGPTKKPDLNMLSG